MNYIILDMEWNQPVHASRMVKHPVPLHGEVVEIGAVKLDEDMKTVSTFKSMVAPKYYKKMQKWVKALTRITEEELHSAADFPSAFFSFLDWCGKDAVIFTWGPDDIPTLKTNALVHGLDDSVIPPHYDLQVIFDDRITKEKRQVSLSRAMKILGEPALEAHDALNDALNTARIFARLDMPVAIAEYAEIRERYEKKPKAEPSARNPQKTYERKSDVLNDTEMTEFACPVCGERAVCYGFVSQNPYKYIALAECANGHELLVGFKFNRPTEKQIKAARVIHEMTDELRENYNVRASAKGTFGKTRDEATKGLAVTV